MAEERLSSHMEDYLEAVLILEEDEGVVRARDIGNLLEVKASSVTNALKKLGREQLINHEKYGYVELTEKGRTQARAILERHNMLIKFLSEILQVDPEVAEKDACKMEHVLSPETSRKLTKFIEFVETCPEYERPDWLKNFDYYFQTGERRQCKKREQSEPVDQ